MLNNNLCTISLVSPVYNEADNIEEFVRRSIKSLKTINNDFEIILVNDCSTDKTEVKLVSLAREFKQIRYITLEKNTGQHAATVIGLKMAKGDFTFLMDSDLQIAPEEMELLFKKWQKISNWDIISGVRAQRSGSIIRNFGSKVMSFFINKVAGTNLKDPGSAFMLIKKHALNDICRYEIQAQNLQILMGMLSLRILEQPVDYSNKAKSSYRFTDLAELFVMAFLNFTTGRKTLLFLSAAGAVFSTFGFFAILFLIIRGMIIASPLPTNLLIFYTFLFITGVQFLFLGIIAFKLERINKNLEFRKWIKRKTSQKADE